MKNIFEIFIKIICVVFIPIGMLLGSAFLINDHSDFSLITLVIMWSIFLAIGISKIGFIMKGNNK